jgi:hypothetical protein
MKTRGSAGIGQATLMAGLLLLAVGTSSAQRAGGLIPRGSVEPDAALLYTGDVIGFIDPCG